MSKKVHGEALKRISAFIEKNKDKMDPDTLKSFEHVEKIYKFLEVKEFNSQYYHDLETFFKSRGNIFKTPASKKSFAEAQKIFKSIRKQVSEELEDIKKVIPQDSKNKIDQDADKAIRALIGQYDSDFTGYSCLDQPTDNTGNPPPGGKTSSI